MTVEHPSIDMIADYCAQLLPADAADAMASHLSECSTCADDAAAVAAVSAALASEARRPLTMPEPVQLSIDEALRAESGGRVVALVPAASRHSASRRLRLTRPILSAAAAVVAIAGITGVVRLAQGTGDEQQQAASTARRADAAGPSQVSPSASPTNGGPPAKGSAPLSRRNLPFYADQLTRGHGPQVNARPQRAPCAAPRVPARDIVTVHQWYRTLAVVTVDPRDRQVTVFDCRTASTLLYQTEY